MTNVNPVSRIVQSRTFSPLTCVNAVSEGGLEPPRRGNFPESGKFHVIRIPDRDCVFKYFARFPHPAWHLETSIWLQPQLSASRAAAEGTSV
jgi:hypothetical protein